MIAITGPGRSGTSLLARLYKEVGFDPLGSWSDDNNAGFEAPDVVVLNQEMLRHLKVTAYGPPRQYKSLTESLGSRPADAIKAVVPASTRRRLRSTSERILRRSANGLSLVPLSQLDEAIERFGTRMRDVAASHEIAKDPLFSWTLPLWLRAGAEIDSVVMSTRQLEQSYGSHAAAGHVRFRNMDDGLNSLVYGLGVVLNACLEHEVPLRLVRFPDFLQDPVMLHRSLTFPRAVTIDDFLAAFERVVEPRSVHRY